MDLTGFSPKDAKIIRDNEGKTAYELIALGLSNAAFTRIIGTATDQQPTAPAPAAAPTPDIPAAIQPEQIASQPPALAESSGLQPATIETASIAPAPIIERPAMPPSDLRPAIVETAPAPAAAPTLSAYRTETSGTNLKQRTVVGPTGIPQKMNAGYAENLVKRNPKLYKIVD